MMCTVGLFMNLLIKTFLIWFDQRAANVILSNAISLMRLCPLGSLLVKQADTSLHLCRDLLWTDCLESVQKDWMLRSGTMISARGCAPTYPPTPTPHPD